MNQILHRVVSVICTPPKSNHLRSLLRAIMALDHHRLIRPRKKIRPNFLRSTSLLYKILPTKLGACKPIFYTIYTSHLRYSTMKSMRHCFYHADLTSDRMQYFTILQYKFYSFILVFRMIEARVGF